MSVASALAITLVLSTSSVAEETMKRVHSPIVERESCLGRSIHTNITSRLGSTCWGFAELKVLQTYVDGELVFEQEWWD